MIQKLFFLWLAILLIACNPGSPDGQREQVISKPVTAIEVVHFDSLVESWSQANNREFYAELQYSYADEVMYYGSRFTLDQCMINKSEFFNKHGDFYQSVVGPVKLDTLSEEEMKASFIKRTVMDGKTRDYPSYLIFRKIGRSWLIATESDLITDQNLGKSRTTHVPDGAVQGDFDGNGSLEYMWMVSPKLDPQGQDCVGSCTGVIHFSDGKLGKISVDNCIGGGPQNLGDLNGDGADEVGLLPEWFTSCWRSYYVWTNHGRGWIQAVDPITTHCDLWNANLKPIAKAPNQPGRVLIHYSDESDGEIVTKSATVAIR